MKPPVNEIRYPVRRGYLLSLLLIICCCGETPSPEQSESGVEGICLTFSSETTPGWSACLPDPAGFVPEALERMHLDCNEAWSRLSDDARAALVASGRIHVGENCTFTPGPGQPAAAALLSLGQRVDLNFATVDDLAALHGIGPALAERIMASRETDGPFCDVDALTRVRGIGPKTLEKLRPYLTASCP